jgi:hypothetical protein
MKPLWDWDSRESRKIRIIKFWNSILKKGQEKKAFDILVNCFKQSSGAVLHSGPNRRKYSLLLPLVKCVYFRRREKDKQNIRNTVCSWKYGRMLNVSNIGLMRYKAGKMATLDSITHIGFFFSQARYPHLMLTQGHNVSVWLSLASLLAVGNVYGQGNGVVFLVVI